METEIRLELLKKRFRKKKRDAKHPRLVPVQHPQKDENVLRPTDTKIAEYEADRIQEEIQYLESGD